MKVSLAILLALTLSCAADNSIFPADNAWNRDISSEPVDPNSEWYVWRGAGR